MKLGDKVLFYHSQEGNEIMGIMRVIEEAHQDKTTEDPNWASVTFEPIQSFSKPISLQLIKGTKELENIGLIKQPRLSVMELTVEEFTLISNMKC